MIRITRLNKSFEGKTVLHDIDLEIREGETMAIIGRSGSGKTVLMKHVVGLLKPDRGQVTVDGVDVQAIPYRRLRQIRQQFGVLFQGGALFDSMNAFENVAFPLRTFKPHLSQKDVQTRTNECLALVQLPDVGDKTPSELSGGMQKRVALARAIALAPRYIIYDEPTSGLDPETSNTIDDLIRSLARELNVTSIVVTHDMHSVLSIADRAAFIHEGRLRWVGTMDELHESTDPILNRFVKANEYQIGTGAYSPASP